MSTVSATWMIISSIIVNFREETSMRIRMVFNASHVAPRLVKMILPFDFFSCNFGEPIFQKFQTKIFSRLDEREQKLWQLNFVVVIKRKLCCPIIIVRNSNWRTRNLALNVSYNCYTYHLDALSAHGDPSCVCHPRHTRTCIWDGPCSRDEGARVCPSRWSLRDGPPLAQRSDGRNERDHHLLRVRVHCQHLRCLQIDIIFTIENCEIVLESFSQIEFKVTRLYYHETL